MSRSGRDHDQTAGTSRAGKSWRRTALGLRETEAAPTELERPRQASLEAYPDAVDAVVGVPSGANDDESFAARLRYLFAATRQSTGRPWSANAVARASGGRLTAQAVYSLYRGATPNPKLETILALAEALGVDPEYFVSPGALGRLKATHAGEYAALAADPRIAFVSRQMGRMTPEDMAIIVAMVQRLSGEQNSKGATTSEPLDSAAMTQMRQDLP